MSWYHYVLIVGIVLAEALTHFGTVEGDSWEFFNVTKYLLGIEPLESPHRIIRPLVPALAAPLYYLLGLPMSYGLVNTLFYVLSGIFAYKLGLELTKSRVAGLVSSLLLITSPPMIAYGSASHYQAGPIFFQFFVIYLAIRWMNALELKRAATLGVVSGLGVLAGESVATSIASTLLLMVLRGRSLGLLLYVTFIAPFLTVPLILGGYDWIRWYLVQNVGGYAPYANLDSPIVWLDPFNRIRHFVVGISFAATLGLLYGFLREDNRERAVIFYVMLLPALLAWLAWPPVNYRVLYPMFHAVYWIAGAGLLSIAQDLSSKPVLRRVPKYVWLVVILVLNAFISNWYVTRYYYLLYGPGMWGPFDWISVPSLEMLEMR
ncbi:MAG: hypothetical protein NZ920_00960 [Aigarchaeota archaeon]|nr:hypothetical protein [Aigarchaeota archaeon]MDW8093012.1 hypothetical protein [Nitrososphaerota archaeon]